MRARTVSRLGAALAVTVVAALLLVGCGGGKPAYEVSVSFNDRYTDAAGAAVEAAVHEFDGGAVVRLQTSFPPIAHATVHTNDASFCDTFRQRLMSRPEVTTINCGAR